VTQLYRHYLSYDALLQCLELNGMADAAVIRRVEAHYTFLGRFLHPTNDAARELHAYSNHHSGAPEIGMAQPYNKEARLLASLYVCYLIAGIIDEVAGLLEAAPKRYIREPGTRALRELTATVPAAFPYFWFLYNEAPLYDKYNYCTHHISEQELVELGHYSKVAGDRVPFEKDVYAHLQQALRGQWGGRCGQYVSPLG
jgi:hypothetical protein